MLTSPPQDAELVFADDVFTPEIDTHLGNDGMIEDEGQSSPATPKISPAVKRKAATEAAKSERCVFPSH